jgi:hypothetical protein
MGRALLTCTFGTLLFLQGCPPPPQPLLYNFLPIQVGPKGPSPSVFLPNVPVVSITICTPGTTNCQTINNIIVDTDSPGLRILKSALHITLPVEQVNANPLGECVGMGAGNMWGPVSRADVTMSGEPAVDVAVQVIDMTFGVSSPPPDFCASNLVDETEGLAGANGILGIAPFQYDNFINTTVSCIGLIPATCTTLGPLPASNYFTCQGGTCTGVSTLFGGLIVQNPVYALPVDNNGVFVYLKDVPDQGASQSSGAVVFGIGTGPTNDPKFISSGNSYSVVPFSTYDFPVAPADLPGCLVCGGNSFLDTSSIMMTFYDPSISRCNVGTLVTFMQTMYCPNPSVTRTAYVPTGPPGSSELNVNFLVGNGMTLVSSGNSAFHNLAAPSPSMLTNSFDWGVPFFFGKSIFIAYGQTPFGSPPMWGYAPLPP